MHASTWALVESDAGVKGYPTLQVGGEQEAVMVADPAEGTERAQDRVQPVVVPITCDCDDDHVRGVLLRTTPPSVLGSELLPMMSITVATAVCADVDPFAAANVVRPDPGAPSSRAIF